MPPKSKPLRPVELGSGWSAFKKAVEKDIREAAKQGKGDPNFELLMRSALNGRTDMLLGWKDTSGTK
jgi:hypothetical protein